MVNPAMEQQANGPPLPFPGQHAGGGGRANGHHLTSSTSTAATVTNGGGEQRMVVRNQTVAEVAGDLEGMVHMWDKTRSAVDTTVDQNLRALSYSVAQSRVLGRIVDMDAVIVDGPGDRDGANASRPSRRRGGHRARSTPPLPQSPQEAFARSPSPSPSSSSAAAMAEEAPAAATTARVGFSSRKGGDGGEGLGLEGFDLQAVLESRDIVEVKKHVRSLHHLAAQQQDMLGELNSEGMRAIDLNHKLSLKLLDKSKELEVIKQAYFLVIEADPALPASNGDMATKPAAAGAAVLPVASPALEPVSSGMTPPPLPRPPLTDSAAAARREHTRTYSGVGIAGGGGAGGWGKGAPTAGGEAGGAWSGAHHEGGARRNDGTGNGHGRTRSGSGVSVGSNASSVRAELFPRAEDAAPGQEMVSPRGHGEAQGRPPPPSQRQGPNVAAFFPTQSSPRFEGTTAGAEEGAKVGDGDGGGGAIAPAAGGIMPTSPRMSRLSPGRGLPAPPTVGGGQDIEGSGACGDGFAAEAAVAAASSGGGSVAGSASTTPRKHPLKGQLAAGAQGASAPPMVSAPPKMSAPPTMSAPPANSGPPVMSGPPTGAAGWTMGPGANEGNAGGAFGAHDEGNGVSEDTLQAMMMPVPQPQLHHRPPAAAAHDNRETAASDGAAANDNDVGAPPLGPPPVLPHPGQPVSYRAVKKPPAGGGGAGFGGPRPTAFGGGGVGPFGGGIARPFGGVASSNTSQDGGDSEGEGGVGVGVRGGVDSESAAAAAAAAAATAAGSGAGDWGTTASNTTAGERSGTSYSSVGSFNGSFGSGRGGGGGGGGGSGGGSVDASAAPEVAAQPPPPHAGVVNDFGDGGGGGNGGEGHSGAGAVEGDGGHAAAAGYPGGGESNGVNGGGFSSSPWPAEAETNTFFGGV
eukprot:g2196.t1